MCQFLGFSGLSSENSLFYSVLRRPAMFEMAHHKPTKSLFLQYLQLVPAKFLGNKAFRICELHFALRFLWFFRKPKLPHRPWRYHPHIYIYICRRVTGLSTFWPFWKLIGCPPFCQNLIFTAGRSILKVNGLATWKLIGCPLLVAIFDPKKWTTH